MNLVDGKSWLVLGWTDRRHHQVGQLNLFNKRTAEIEHGDWSKNVDRGLRDGVLQTKIV